MSWGDFDNVKVGDHVAVGKWGADGYDKFPVQKVTATQFTVNGRRYSKSRGELIGDSYAHSREKYVSPWTEETERLNSEAELLRQRNDKIKRYKEVNPRSLSDDQLDAILNIVEPTTKAARAAGGTP